MIVAVKRFLLPVWLGSLTFGLVVSGAAQSPAAEIVQRMSNAYTFTASSGRVRLSLAGMERVGDSEVPFALRADWMTSVTEGGYPGVFLDFNLIQNGATVQRLVGDGVMLWNYRVARNDFSGFAYGNPDGAPSAGFVGRLVKGLQQQARGVAGWPARLLGDLFAPSATAQWRPWMPAATVTMSGDVVSEAIGSRYRVEYTLASPAQGEPERLASIRFSEVSTLGEHARIVEWVMRVEDRPTPDDANFRFVPPAGARALGSTLGAPKAP